jgi:ABC-2 type transport system permease protein
MTADAQPAAGSLGHDPVSLWRRLYGLGSVFGKTLRDSRRATILVGAILGLILIGVSKAIVSQFATVESRQEIANLVASVPPIMQGLAGKPINVETLGGYLQYKYGTFFPIVASLWSILALSGTLAAEARRGSLEFLVAAPVPRRQIAIEKLLGHIVPVVIAMILIFVSIAVAGTFGTLPGDEIPIAAAAGYAVWLGLLALASGSVAFAISPFLGRGAAAGIVGAVMFGGFILNGYQSAIPGLTPFANLTWFGWTSNHIPLAGLYDWPSLGIVAIVAVLLFTIGIEAFVRRDLGATSAVPTPSLPASLVGLRGPTGRAAGEILPSAMAWGLGLGIFGLLIAGSGRSFEEQLAKAPDFVRLLESVFPGIQLSSTGAFLELLFIEFGLILAGLAAATLVSIWASDETSGRLELVLASPLARRQWVVSGAVGALIGAGVFTVFAAVGIGIGALITGGDLITPVVGTASLGIYAAAMVGIGVAVGGVIGTPAAGPTVAVLTVLIWMIDIIGPPLGLPDAIQELALTSHFGQPMLGSWDPVGIVASLAIAAGGVAIGAWGFARRDLRS